MLFPNFERPDEYIKEVLTEKIATKLMAESGNIFENFIANFYVKFGKLQIKGFHGKGGVPAFSNNRTVSPGKQRMMSNIRGADSQGAKKRRYESYHENENQYVLALLNQLKKFSYVFVVD